MAELLLIHGFATDGSVWNGFKTGLGSAHTVMSPDLPGHGLNKEPFKGFRPAAEYLAGLLKEAGREKWVVVGWSMGGQIALELCDMFPDRVSKLLLICSTPRFTSQEFDHGYNMAVFRKFLKEIKSDNRKALDGFYSMMFPGDAKAGCYVRELTLHIPTRETLLSSMEALASSDERRILAGIKVPTMVIAGEKDVICSPDASNYMADKINGAKAYIMKGAGHAPHISNCRELTDVIRPFIG
jgi:pimeloyl-[acyl-carrier protein] methyl ester esterase